MKFHYQRRARFWLSMLATVLQLAGVSLLGFWLLPSAGISVPWFFVLGVLIIMVATDSFMYFVGSKAMDRTPVTGKEAILGSVGRVATPLTPNGMVRIQGELWQARSEAGDISSGDVEVVGHKGLKLLVKPHKQEVNRCSQDI